jgi:hypothetical protein
MEQARRRREDMLPKPMTLGLVPTLLWEDNHKEAANFNQLELLLLLMEDTNLQQKRSQHTGRRSMELKLEHLARQSRVMEAPLNLVAV